MKQIIFVFGNKGEKVAIKNENVVVYDEEKKIKFQCTCYRVFLINVIGEISLTSVLIKKSKKFGFFIAMYSSGMHLYEIIGAVKEGNYILKKKQYEANTKDIAKHILLNKISTEYETIKNIRSLEDKNKTLSILKDNFEKIFVDDKYNLLLYEGISAKVYFNALFSDYSWKGRKPRIKTDIINSSLDIGYTMLFNFIDAILNCFGFDTYVGVYHKQFYMRKSLSCDIIEPFRYLIDTSVRKGLNLGIIKTDDFEIINHQYKLKWKENIKYIELFMKTILDNKEIIFRYIQSYYRCFMKDSEITEYPYIYEGEVKNGPYKL